jgi:cache domain-containing protein
MRIKDGRSIARQSKTNDRWERLMIPQLARPLLVLALLSLFVSNATAAQVGDNVTLNPRTGLDAYAALVEAEFESARTGLRIVAATENAGSADWDRIKLPLTLFAKSLPTSAAVWFARPDGSYFTVDAGLAKDNLRDRDYFPRLMAGKEVVSALVVSKSTGKRSAIIAVPVQKDGRVIGALGVSVATEKIADLVDDKIPFPRRMVFYALDDHGQISLHRESALLFEFAGKLGSPSLTEAVKEMLSKPDGTVHYEFRGTEREAIFKRSNITGWVYALRW